MRSNKIGLFAALAFVGVSVGGCRYDHPGNASDRHHGRHHGDGDRDRDRDHDRPRYR